jgi:hypothetical protein
MIAIAAPPKIALCHLGGGKEKSLSDEEQDIINNIEMQKISTNKTILLDIINW